jgi:alpha-tubulin suppressor-like RCC1 family protein
MKNLNSKLISIAFISLVLSLALGLRAASIRIAPANPTIPVGETLQFAADGGMTPTAASAGGWHTCVLLSDQSVQCTGRNNFGQLGDGTLNDSSDLIGVGGIAGAIGIGTGFEYTCALLGDRTMQCWGSNYTGQLGDGTIGGYSPTPVRVQGLANIMTAAVGGFHACAMLSDHTVRCWGRNADGQVGNGTLTDATTPQSVTGLGSVAALVAGGYHTCVLMFDSTVRCWGRNDDGQLGDGTGRTSSTPVQVSGISSAVAITGGGYHTCALLSSGTVQCWGRNSFGQVGGPTSTAAFYAPITVSGISGAIAVVGGGYHGCAVLSDRTMRCWGENDFGELGNGGTANSSIPVPVSGIASPTFVTLGGWHSCVLMPDQTVRCWGQNDYGQLGNHGTSRALTAVTMNGSGVTGVTWTSSDDTVATIDATGLARGLSGGSTTITASDSSGGTASTVLTVTPNQSSWTLSVLRQGDGTGTVTSNPGGVDCGTTCSALYVNGTDVTLTAAAASGSVFTGWVGCDAVFGTTCSVNMTAARSVKATFTRERFTLTVNKTGLGDGTVTSSPSGIDCGGTCAATYLANTTVTLTARPDLLSLFTGWSGCDSTSGTTCTVAVRANRAVTASFLGVSIF